MSAVTTKPMSARGKLRIGDDWNAITIIALSQSNPLKAVAEFVENSIDAGAQHIEISRGREQGEAYLRIRDDGQGIPKDTQGIPNFKYVATHICDSVKRQLKANGANGLQGEFGIGLLSFWTVGEALFMRSPSADGKTFEMHMSKGNPSYTVSQRRALFAESGTELTIKPLLPGLRQLSGEKIQWYLASELRNRIRYSGVEITVVDRTARKHYRVEPRKFDGRLLHDLPMPETESLYVELYLGEPDSRGPVGLYRSGTRVLESITSLEVFDREPWRSNYLTGIVDCSNLNLTPGSRLGVVRDSAFMEFVESLKSIEAMVSKEIEAQKRAGEERASSQILRTLTRAFREALITLPAEEYDWFELQRQSNQGQSNQGQSNQGQSNKNSPGNESSANTNDDTRTDTQGVDAEALLPEEGTDHEDSLGGSQTTPTQKQFFEYAGPLANVRISPSSSVIRVDRSRTFRAVSRDQKRRLIDREVLYQWRVTDGGGRLENAEGEIMTFHALSEPGLVKLSLIATEGGQICEAEALITVAETLVASPRGGDGTPKQGLPAYSFQHAAGGLWRSRFEVERNLIIVNSGHRDFVFASRTKALKLRYICRLYAKELVLKNFPGVRPEELLERMLEISLYVEENLR